jgi:hypothetical protein
MSLARVQNFSISLGRFCDEPCAGIEVHAALGQVCSRKGPRGQEPGWAVSSTAWTPRCSRRSGRDA